MEKTEALIDLCIARGVNYFDTAWFYHNGKSEEIMGKLLAKYPRESYYIADKIGFGKSVIMEAYRTSVLLAAISLVLSAVEHKSPQATETEAVIGLAVKRRGIARHLLGIGASRVVISS